MKLNNFKIKSLPLNKKMSDLVKLYKLNKKLIYSNSIFLLISKEFWIAIMWIVLNKSFLSIVKNRNNDSELLVRARVKGDIEKVFDEADVFEDENADYR